MPRAKITRGITAFGGGPYYPPHILFPIQITSEYSTSVTFLPPLNSVVSTVAPNNPLYLGQLTPSSILVLIMAEPKDEGVFELKLEMDDQKIWRVEDARKNSDVCLQIRIEGLAFVEEKGRTVY